MSSDLAFLMLVGREFHRRGPATWTHYLPYVSEFLEWKEVYSHVMSEWHMRGTTCMSPILLGFDVTMRSKTLFDTGLVTLSCNCDKQLLSRKSMNFVCRALVLLLVWVQLFQSIPGTFKSPPITKFRCFLPFLLKTFSTVTLRNPGIEDFCYLVTYSN